MNEGTDMICPMNTKGGAEILVDYCAFRLDPARAAEFEKHMEGCPDCRRAVEGQRGVWQTLEHWTPAEISPDFDARVYARIAQEEAAPRWRQWWLRMFHPAVPVPLWKPAVSLAAAGAVLALGLVVGIPNLGDAGSGMRSEKVDIDQVEKTLEDLDMLTPLSPGPAI